MFQLRKYKLMFGFFKKFDNSSIVVSEFANAIKEKIMNNVRDNLYNMKEALKTSVVQQVLDQLTSGSIGRIDDTPDGRRNLELLRRKVAATIEASVELQVSSAIDRIQKG